MEYAPFIRKQLQWAKRHGESATDEERATWWLARIKEIEALEAKTFSAASTSEQPVSIEHPGEQPAA